MTMSPLAGLACAAAACGLAVTSLHWGLEAGVSPAAKAQSGSRTNGPSGPDSQPEIVVDQGDGSGWASAGSPPWPGLLKRYPGRPPWKVAGVDYRVGLAPGSVLKSAGALAMAGVSVDARTHEIVIGSGPVTLDGYDFSGEGGWHVEIRNPTGSTVIRNSLFRVGRNNLVPIAVSGSAPVVVVGNSFDGGGPDGAVHTALLAGSSATITYNTFRNMPDDAIDIIGDGRFVIRFNTFENMNWKEAYHSDCIQSYFSAIAALDVQYNTLRQSEASSLGWPGAMNSFIRIGDEHGMVVSHPVVAHNTLVFLGSTGHHGGPGATANVFDISAGDGVPGSAVEHLTVHDNYLDPSGVMYGVFSPYADQLDSPRYSGNVNMTETPSRDLLAGQYNSWTRGVPDQPPEPPRILGTMALDEGRVALAGVAEPGTTVAVMGAVMGAVTDLGIAKPDHQGMWSMTTKPLGRDQPPLRATTIDPWGNASATVAVSTLPSSATLPQ